MRRLALPVAAALTVVAVCVAVLATPTPANAASSTTTVRAWTWNVSGNNFNDGRTDTGLTDQIVRSLQKYDVTFAAFQEICYGQFYDIKQKLQDIGWLTSWTDQSKFSTAVGLGTRDNTRWSNICAGQEYGNAIISKVPLAVADTANILLGTDFHWSHPEERRLLCVPTQATPSVLFCTTHLTAPGESSEAPTQNTTELSNAYDYLQTHYGTKSVIVAGDYNIGPSRPNFNAWYSATVNTSLNNGNHGPFDEIDDQDATCPGFGQASTQPANPPSPCYGKIDHIFIRHNRIVGALTASTHLIPLTCTIHGVPDSACSDHRVLEGSVTVLTAAVLQLAPEERAQPPTLAHPRRAPARDRHLDREDLPPPPTPRHTRPAHTDRVRETDPSRSRGLTHPPRPGQLTSGQSLHMWRGPSPDPLYLF